jgi:hypothetical protein
VFLAHSLANLCVAVDQAGGEREAGDPENVHIQLGFKEKDRG